MNTTIVFAFIAGTTIICGLLSAAIPFLMPKSECFAVTVPEEAYNHPVLKTYRKKYAALCIILTAGIAVASGTGAWLIADGSAAAHESTIIILCLLPIAIVTFIPYLLMLHYRKKVSSLKREEDWTAHTSQRAAVICEEATAGPIPLAWNILYIPVILAIAALGVILYPGIPDPIPMHMDFEGNVDAYAAKSNGSVFGFPIGLTAFLAICMIFSHWIMTRSKRPISPNAPASSALAYGLFARAQSILLLASGLLISAALGIGFLLSSAAIISLGQVVALVLIACVPVVAGSIAITVIYGQSGTKIQARLAAREANDGEMPIDDDEHWKLGIFYFNPQDPSLWLPERFGIGWTMNFGRPAAWLVVAGFAIVATGLIIFVTSLSS